MTHPAELNNGGMHKIPLELNTAHKRYTNVAKLFYQFTNIATNIVCRLNSLSMHLLETKSSETPSTCTFVGQVHVDFIAGWLRWYTGEHCISKWCNESEIICHHAL